MDRCKLIIETCSAAGAIAWAIASIDVGNSFVLDIVAITLDGCPVGTVNATKRG